MGGGGSGALRFVSGDFYIPNDIFTPKYAYTFDPKKSEWADYATVQAYCGSLFKYELTCNLSGNIQPFISAR